MRDIPLEHIDADALVRDAAQQAQSAGEVTYLTRDGQRVAAVVPAGPECPSIIHLTSQREETG